MVFDYESSKIYCRWCPWSCNKWSTKKGIYKDARGAKIKTFERKYQIGKLFDHVQLKHPIQFRRAMLSTKGMRLMEEFMGDSLDENYQD